MALQQVAIIALRLLLIYRGREVCQVRLPVEVIRLLPVVIGTKLIKTMLQLVVAATILLLVRTQVSQVGKATLLTDSRLLLLVRTMKPTE